MSLINLVGNVVTPNYDSLYLVHSEILDEAVRDHGAIIDGAVGSLVAVQDSEAKVEIKDLHRATPNSAPQNDASNRMNTDISAGSAAQDTQILTLDTSIVNRLAPNDLSGQDHQIAFSCPIFERVDKPRQTRILADQNPGKSWGYFNYKNRSDIAIPWYSYFFFTFISVLLGSLSLLPIGLLSRLQEQNSKHEQRVWIVSWTIFGFVIGTFGGFWTSVLDLKTYRWNNLSKSVRFFGKILFAAFFAAPGVGGFIMVGKMLREYGNCVNLF